MEDIFRYEFLRREMASLPNSGITSVEVVTPIIDNTNEVKDEPIKDSETLEDSAS